MRGSMKGIPILVVGFGATVATWFVGYVGRLPGVMTPSPLLVAAMLACLAIAGLILGRHGGSWRAGAAAGAVSGA